MNRIPAGIIDNDIEFFHTPCGMNAFVGGEIVKWNALPERIKNLVREDLHRNPEALDRLAHLPADEQLQLYAKCKFGAMGSGEADMTLSGKSNGEYWCDCDSCPLKSVLRGKLQVENGWLTQREIEVARLIAKGLFGKEISTQLGISESTINTHKKNIFEKTGLKSSVEITGWANKINLI